MESEAFRAEVKPQEIVHRIIWIAFVGVIPMYVCAAYLLLGRAATGDRLLPSQPLTIPFVILSVLGAGLAPYMPRIVLPEARIRQLLSGASGSQARAGISADEYSLLVLLPNFFVGFIVRLAFNESIALYGFVLALLSKSFSAILPFAIVSFALNLMVPMPLNSVRQRLAGLDLQQGGIPTHPR
jgi:hypothetical protein